MNSITITPLGAAVVEAMPDRAAVNKVKREFKQSHRCPMSEIFPTARDVEEFYAKQGQSIEAFAKAKAVAKKRKRNKADK